jgi:hypothetical protein
MEAPIVVDGVRYVSDEVGGPFPFHGRYLDGFDPENGTGSGHNGKPATAAATEV